MSREEYAAYLREQAKLLTWLAEEVESGGEIVSDWLIDWEIHYEKSLLQPTEEASEVA